MQLSILFVPFDAAIQHYQRNSTNGVNGYTVDQEPTKAQKRRRDEEVQVEAPGTAVEFRPAKKLGTNPIQAQTSLRQLVEAIVSHTCQQIVDETDVTSSHPYEGSLADTSATQKAFSDFVARKQIKIYPEIIFLSEQPGEVEFPKQLSLLTSHGKTVQYRLEGQAGSKAVQRIFGYVRQDLGGTWSFSALTKTATVGGAEEHVLVGTGVMSNQKPCSFAGVHLSSKNVGASSAQREQILNELVAFCATHKIQFVLGDFNIDTHTSDDRGAVGARPGTMTFMNDGVSSSFGLRFQEQYSNSNNQMHFMGHLIIDPEVSRRGMVGLSLQRSMGSSYFSDHPPIFVLLDFP